MKRVVYLAIVLIAAAAFYVYAYPRLTGGGVATAQQTASTSGNARSGAAFATAVVTAVAQKQTLPITKSSLGYVEAADTVVVRPRTDGIVVETDVTEGQTVKAGAVLFKLDDQAAQATIAKDQANIAKDQANADSAQATLKREQDLVKKQVDPQATLDVDVAAAKVAQATIAVDQAQLRADQVDESYTTITAPIDGRVGTVNTSVGNVVSSSDTSAGGLVTITRMDVLRVSFSIPEDDLDTFRSALAKNQKLPVQIMAPADKQPRATGTLSFIDSSVDTGSGTIVIKADVANTSGVLWPGQYVTAITQLGAYTDVTTVPLVAIQQSDAGPYVFSVGSDQKVKKQPVTLVATINDTAVIGKELKPGDHVVVEGQLRLADGATVKETVQAKPTQVADSQAAGGEGKPAGAGVNAGSSTPSTPGGSGDNAGSGSSAASGASTAGAAGNAAGASGTGSTSGSAAAGVGNGGAAAAGSGAGNS